MDNNNIDNKDIQTDLLRLMYERLKTEALDSKKSVDVSTSTEPTEPTEPTETDEENREESFIKLKHLGRLIENLEKQWKLLYDEDHTIFDMFGEVLNLTEEEIETANRLIKEKGNPDDIGNLYREIKQNKNIVRLKDLSDVQHRAFIVMFIKQYLKNLGLFDDSILSIKANEVWENLNPTLKKLLETIARYHSNTYLGFNYKNYNVKMIGSTHKEIAPILKEIQEIGLFSECKCEPIDEKEITRLFYVHRNIAKIAVLYTFDTRVKSRAIRPLPSEYVNNDELLKAFETLNNFEVFIKINNGNFRYFLKEEDMTPDEVVGIFKDRWFDLPKPLFGKTEYDVVEKPKPAPTPTPHPPVASPKPEPQPKDEEIDIIIGDNGSLLIGKKPHVDNIDGDVTHPYQSHYNLRFILTLISKVFKEDYTYYMKEYLEEFTENDYDNTDFAEYVIKKINDYKDKFVLTDFYNLGITLEEALKIVEKFIVEYSKKIRSTNIKANPVIEWITDLLDLHISGENDNIHSGLILNQLIGVPFEYVE